MRITRSASAAAKRTVTDNDNDKYILPSVTSEPVPDSKKRKTSGTSVTATKASKSKKARSAKETQNADLATTKPEVVVPNANTNAAATAARVVPVPMSGQAQSLVPAELTFSFEDAKRHLINIDQRFQELFNRLKCRPFEHLERVDPFRTLAHSIMGQQISWRAARSIIHRFIRLFDPSLPEKAEDYKQNDFFPTAHQVVSTDIATLRSAGLSGRKAEYVLDLASRFSDGRLSTEKLLEANDEELGNMLIEVRGIGRWTVDMFAMFSLRRPDILPVGDLGVQRGVLRWFLSLHAPTYRLALSPEKAPKSPDEEEETRQSQSQSQTTNAQTQGSQVAESSQSTGRALTPDLSYVLPVPHIDLKTPAASQQDPGPLPPPFTPSINQTLNMQMGTPAPLPEGLTPSILRTRLGGKSKIKGALLTPKEMEGLTNAWRPYRSLAVYYMWALAEEKN